jgi:hypothetical protein
MIVRFALKCETCGQPHTVRIGMGHDQTQTHKFLCRGCSEEIVLRMDLDYAELSWDVKCVENYSPTDEVAGAPIVNVDAIFVIPPELQGLDTVFPRFAYSFDMYEAAKRAGSVVDISALPADALNRRRIDLLIMRRSGSCSAELGRWPRTATSHYPKNGSQRLRPSCIRTIH